MYASHVTSNNYLLNIAWQAGKRYARLETGEAASWASDASQACGGSDASLFLADKGQAPSESLILCPFAIPSTSAAKQAPRALNSLSPAFAPSYSPKMAWQRVRQSALRKNAHPAP